VLEGGNIMEFGVGVLFRWAESGGLLEMLTWVPSQSTTGWKAVLRFDTSVTVPLEPSEVNAVKSRLGEDALAVRQATTGRSGE
jgi:hypothetical protein